MDKKLKVDIISKQLDTLKMKSFGFLAISGGSWVYAIKTDVSILINIGAWIIFALTTFGLLINFEKIGTLYKELEEIKNDTV